MRRLIPRRSAFTLIELLMSITIVILLAALVVPQLQDDDGVRLIAASRLVGSDVEMAQVMTISNPAKPVVVRFQPGAGKYWLAYAAEPDKPIDRPGTPDKYIVQFGQGQAAGAAGVTMQVAGLTSNTLTFNAQGGVDITVAGSPPAVRLVCLPGPRWIQLSIAPITGTITETTGG